MSVLRSTQVTTAERTRVTICARQKALYCAMKNCHRFCVEVVVEESDLITHSHDAWVLNLKGESHDVICALTDATRAFPPCFHHHRPRPVSRWCVRASRGGSPAHTKRCTITRAPFQLTVASEPQTIVPVPNCRL